MVSSPNKDLSSKSVSLPRPGETTGRRRNLHPCPPWELGGFISFPGPFSFNRKQRDSRPPAHRAAGTYIKWGVTYLVLGWCWLPLLLTVGMGAEKFGSSGGRCLWRGPLTWADWVTRRSVRTETSWSPGALHLNCLIDTCSHSEGRGLLKPCSTDPL